MAEHGENMEPLGDRAGDAQFDIGETVTLGEDDEFYPGEQAIIRKRGIGTGWYGNSIVYDVAVVGVHGDDADEDDLHRVIEENIS